MILLPHGEKDVKTYNTKNKRIPALKSALVLSPKRGVFQSPGSFFYCLFKKLSTILSCEYLNKNKDIEKLSTGNNTKIGSYPQDKTPITIRVLYGLSTVSTGFPYTDNIYTLRKKPCESRYLKEGF